jgi:hypothetical protein
VAVRIFVSFSGEDRPFVRRLLARLQAQPLEAWDYSREDQEVHGGAELIDDLRRQTQVSPFKRPLHLGRARHFLNARAVDVSC